VSLLLDAGKDASATLADNAGVTALALVEKTLKKDQCAHGFAIELLPGTVQGTVRECYCTAWCRETWDSLTPEEQGDEGLPDRFPSMLRLLEEKKRRNRGGKKKKKRADKEWQAEEKRRAEMKRLVEQLRIPEDL
jgi:hypothetical protein